MSIWFLQALVSSVKGQVVTVESWHLLPLSNPSPPIICSSPPSLLRPGAVRSSEGLSSEQNVSLHVRLVLEQDGSLMFSSAGLTLGEGQEANTLRVEWVDGWTDRDVLSLSYYSRAPVCTLIQAGLNPSSLHPPHSLSVHPSLPLSHTFTVSDSLALIFSRSLSDLLSFLLFFSCFFFTLISYTPLCFLQNHFLVIILVTKRYYRIMQKKRGKKWEHWQEKLKGKKEVCKDILGDSSWWTWETHDRHFETPSGQAMSHRICSHCFWSFQKPIAKKAKLG